MTDAPLNFADCALVGIDIDGTLTDGFLSWGGYDVGWTQRYAVRDGEALVRLRQRDFPVVPISRNKSACARARMEHLGLPLRWVGITDKLLALKEVEAEYGIDRSRIAYIGDGREDVDIFRAIGFPCCVPTGHPEAQRAARFITQRRGGEGAVEEVVDLLLARSS